MKKITVCVPVINRYDLLKNMLATLVLGSREPDKIAIIDNGRDGHRLQDALSVLQGSGIQTSVMVPIEPMALATCWNDFLLFTDEERIIANDDLLFGYDSLERMVETPGLFVSALANTNAAFSCFLIRDECVKKVGSFDESISPGYAYFEDCDYGIRMHLAGISITPVNCGVQHVGSASLVENPEHHRRFNLAKKNFTKKWQHLSDEQLSVVGLTRKRLE